MKAWRTVMEEWEQTAKQFKSNAEFLESLCQDKLTHLYQDKRKARKTYQEEHHKIASQFTNVSHTINQSTQVTSSWQFIGMRPLKRSQACVRRGDFHCIKIKVKYTC